MNKRFTFLLTALFAVTSLWAQEFQSGDLKYKVISSSNKGNAVEVRMSNNRNLKDVTIPKTVENEGVKYNVTSIGFMAFFHCLSLTSITIPESVTSIEERAFSGCSSLTTITIPESVTNIGREAFWDCKGLTSIIIPKSVTSIGKEALSGCTSLESIV